MTRNEKGLTLIEVLAAVVILSILVLTFTNLSSFTMLSSSKTDKKAGAIQLAELTMNTLREKVNTANANSAIMNISTLPAPSPSVVNGYTITMLETPLTPNPTYTQPDSTNKVSVQDIFIFHDPDPLIHKDVNRLVTVIVTWAG
jgi:prepilin-type N-terminal cleavage/methylation domain-containing protein